MRRSIIYTLLITWFLFFPACKTSAVQTFVKAKNTGITEDINPADSQLIQIYLSYRKNPEKDMSKVISYIERKNNGKNYSHFPFII